MHEENLLELTTMEAINAYLKVTIPSKMHLYVLEITFTAFKFI